MGQERVELRVDGMTCDGCAAHVRQALEKVAGVQSVVVPDWREGRAAVVAAADLPNEALVEAVAGAGYKAAVVSREPLVEKTGPVRPGEAEVDLLIIGAGSAGFAAGIRAAELGYSALMVERGAIGGTCVNVGCVPSKTLLRAAEAYHRGFHSPFAGVRPQGADLDWQAVVGEKDELVARLRWEKYEKVVEAYPSLSLMRGEARLTDDGGVKVDGRTYRPARILIAAGAHPYIPPFPGVDEMGVLTSTEALSLPKRPESLIVLGGRYVALELAQMFARFGTRVTLLQRSDRILPDHEPEIADGLTDSLRQEGVEIYTGVRILHLRQEGAERVVEAWIEGEKRTFSATHVLVATGRRANTDGLGLEAAGVETDGQGFVRVDSTMRTTNPRIYAAGDVTGPPMLVYLAAAEGKRAAENALLGRAEPLDRRMVPAVLFTDPQVATVGLTEAEAQAQGIEVRTSILPLDYVPRALAARDTRGLIKLVAEAGTDRLLGAHVLAAEGGEVVQTATIALRAGMRVQDLVETLFPYLTQVEGLKLAALGFDKDVEQLSCCAG
ncbi:MAG TPA: mercury(II) reductase [Anaerolineae bacterium]|nr:mercury(II) reductase [Anaerolineae bacterium]